MRPLTAELMKMWPISTRVDKPENDDPSIVEPIELATGYDGLTPIVPSSVRHHRSVQQRLRFEGR
jgi:hypothetical protein